MTLEPVHSRVLEAVGHDPRSKSLVLIFRDSSAFLYRPVPTRVHRELMHAASLSEYFQHHIRDRYSTSKLPEGAFVAGSAIQQTVTA